MKVLVTGGSGLLGSNIKKAKGGWYYPSHKNFDITKERQMQDYLNDHKFNEDDLILHCAAFTGIKECETMKHMARLVNVTGTENVIKTAFKKNIFVIYISTDYVFKGKQGNYKEGDRTEPMTYYGLTKLEPEKFVLGYGKSTVIRTSFIQGDEWPHPAAFENKYSSFVKVDKLVEALIKIIEDENRPLGLLHVGGKRKSFYEMAQSIDPEISKISLKDLNLDIPPDTSLNVSRYVSLYGSIKE